MANRKMWMGPRGGEQWVPMPATGLDTSAAGYAGNATAYISGGVGLHTSYAAHKEYSMSWPVGGRDDLRPIADMAVGLYGSGPIFFIDPTAADKNILPMQWSFPALAALDGPVLFGSDRPSTVPTATNTLGYPALSAQMTTVVGPASTYTYAWTGTPNASTSTEYVNGVFDTMNLCTNPRATTATGYSGEGSSENPAPTINSFGSPYPSVTNRVRVTATVSNTYLGVHYQLSGVVPYGVYSMSCTMDSSTTSSGNYRFWVIWQDSSGNQISVASGPAFATGTSGGYVNISFAATTAPAGAAQAVIIMRKEATVAAGEFVEAMALSVLQAPSVQPYFDGSMGIVTVSPAPVPPTSSTLYVPIPPGYELWIGWHGSTDGNGGVQVAPVAPGNATGTPQVLTPLAVTDSTRVNTSFSSVNCQGVEVSFTLGTSTTVTIAGIIAQILPLGATPMTGGFISGQGHSGCGFTQKPTMQAITMAIGTDGLISMAAKFSEIGDWS